MEFSKIFFLVALGLLTIPRVPLAQCYRMLGLFPYTGKSHFIMAESLMKGLASRGHRVDVVSPFPLEVTIPNYTDISLKGLLPTATNNLSIASIHKYPFVSVKRMAHASGLAACSLLGHPKLQKILKNPPTDPPYDLVIVEVFVTPCYLAVGRHLNLPIVGMSALLDWLSESFGTPAATAFVPNVFHGYSQTMNFWERLMNTLQHYVYYAQLDYYTEAQNELVRKHVDPECPDVRQLYNELSLLLVNSHYSMKRIRPITPAVVEIAGLHLNDDPLKLDPDLENWLDKSEAGCVYFTCGSMVKIESFPREILDALYEAFRRIAPIRILMKITNEKQLPPDLPANVKTRSWFPQLSVLKHRNVRAFMSHSGIFGIQEAIYCAVPLISIPLFGDQRANAEKFSHEKIVYPLSFSDITADNVECAIKTVFKDPSYRENIEKLRKIFLDRPMKPLDTAIYWIEYVVRNGNVLRSPAMDIAWWQRSLLDVYAVILLFVILVLYGSVVLCILKPLKYYRSYLSQRETPRNDRRPSVRTEFKTIIKKVK